jgi:hypothetical protein
MRGRVGAIPVNADGLKQEIAMDRERRITTYS